MKHRETVVSLIAVALLFAVAASAQTYTVLHAYPIGAGAYSGIGFPQVMSQGQDGDLYTTIQNDGTHNVGTVYKMTTAGAMTTVYNFCSLTSCTDGAYPNGGVTLGFDGNFYGTTAGGGSHGAGTVFKVTPTGTLTTLWNFANGTDDSAPVYTTLQGQDGNMYGVSEEQYVGQTERSSRSLLQVYLRSFATSTTPTAPVPTCRHRVPTATFMEPRKVVETRLQVRGGIQGTATGAVTVLHTFNGYPTDGNRPLGILVQGSDGNFYGTTYHGGTTNNNGTVFKITPTGAYTVLHSFNYGNGTL